MRMLEEGVATAEESTPPWSSATSTRPAHCAPSTSSGSTYACPIAEHLAEHLAQEVGARFTPPAILREKVAAGHLGRKSGQGLYTW
jgi:3-hydroxybutyryl-CoA dehydrogenase